MATEMEFEVIWRNESETELYTASPSDLPYDGEYASYPEVGNIIAALLYLIISFVGIVGNAMVLLAVMMSRRLQTSANAFVVALSVSDFITSVTLPVQSAALLGVWSQVFFLFCSVAATSYYIFIGANVHLLAAIAFNRYIHITKQAHTYRKQFKRRRVMFMVVLSYGIPLSSTVLAHAFGGARSGICPSDKARVNTCTVIGQTFDYVIASIIVVLVTITLVFYILIYVHVRHHFKAVAVKITCEDDISVIYRGSISATGKFSSLSRSSSEVSDAHGHDGEQELPQPTQRNTLHPSSAKASRPRHITKRVVLDNSGDIAETSMSYPTDVPSTSSGNLSSGLGSELNRHQEQARKGPGLYHYAWPHPEERRRKPMASFQSSVDESPDEFNLHSQIRVDESSINEVFFRAKVSSSAVSANPSPTNSANVVIAQHRNKVKKHKRRLLRFGKNDIESKITTNMFLVVLAFLACLSPTIIFLCVVHTLINSSVGCTISEAYVLIILSANCCINPIIYGWRHPLFQRVFVCILRGKYQEIEKPSAWVRRLLR